MWTTLFASLCKPARGRRDVRLGGTTKGKSSGIQRTMTSASSPTQFKALRHRRGNPTSSPRSTTCTVVSRSLRSDRAVFKLSDGTTLDERRFFPLGEGDEVAHTTDSLAVHV